MIKNRMSKKLSLSYYRHILLQNNKKFQITIEILLINHLPTHFIKEKKKKKSIKFHYLPKTKVFFKIKKKMKKKL